MSSTASTEAEKRQAVIDAHRHVASLLEDHDALPAPAVYPDGTISWRLYSFECPDGIPAMVAYIRRAIGGKWDKAEQDDFMGAEMVFTHPGYRVTVKRDAVCTRRVVGTKTETKPAISLPERVETTEIVEWDCSPLLAEVSR